MNKVLAVYGSPRREGNTSLLLKKAVHGVREMDVEVDEIVLRDLKMSPCLEIYGCKKTGRCVIKDDFQKIYDKLDQCDGLMLATPVFFYTVSALTKILIDRCQSFWVRKNWLNQSSDVPAEIKRKGLLISVGATKGKKLFDGMLLTIRYFFDVLDMDLYAARLYRQLDFEGDVLKYPQYLEEVYETGRAYALSLKEAKELTRTDP
jgi:multimeric flavodoxin WrbA